MDTKVNSRQWSRRHLNERRIARTGMLLLLLMLAAVVQAQFLYTTDNSTITITGYAGPGGDVTIPSTIDELPVTRIGDEAFFQCYALTSVTIPDSVSSIGINSFYCCESLLSLTIGSSVASIGSNAFVHCRNLTSVTIPNSVTNIGDAAFADCLGLASVTIGNSVTCIGDGAFVSCVNLTSVTIPDSVINIGSWAFGCCCPGPTTAPTGLTSVTIGNSVTRIGDGAFYQCYALTSVYFRGDAPSLGGTSVFQRDDHATIYYLTGTTGWGPTFGGRPTWPPAIQTSPQSQTAEAGSDVGWWVDTSSPLPLIYLWYLKATNLLSCSPNCDLELTNVQFLQSGAYTVIVTNVLGAATSSPALLNVIAPVERRPVPGVKVTGETGSLLNVDYASTLVPAPDWTTVSSVSLTSTSGYYFDLTLPLPPQRFFRAWQAGTPGLILSLDLHLIPAITLRGNIGDSWRLDYINQFGPIDAWATLDTVTLTNTSQLYFDVSSVGQPQRLYRLVQVP